MPMLKQVVPVPLRPRHLTKSMRELPVFITINTDGTIVVDLDEADVANAIAAILNLPLHEGD